MAQRGNREHQKGSSKGTPAGHCQGPGRERRAEMAPTGHQEASVLTIGTYALMPVKVYIKIVTIDKHKIVGDTTNPLTDIQLAGYLQ